MGPPLQNWNPMEDASAVSITTDKQSLAKSEPVSETGLGLRHPSLSRPWIAVTDGNLSKSLH